MTVLALVRTPLNVVCTREALDLLDLDPADTYLAIYDTPRPAARRQLWSALDDTGLLDDVGTVSLLPQVAPLTTMQRLRSLARRIGPVDDLLIGNYMFGPFRYLVDLVGPRRVVLIDDGAATVQVARRRLEWSEQGRPVEHLAWSRSTTLESPTDRVQARLGRALAQLRLHPGLYADIAQEPDELTICTFLEMPPALADPVVRHTFASLAAGLDTAPRSDGTLLLGSPLVRTGKIGSSEYLDYLTRARDAIGDFVYIAHRQERPEDRRAIERRVGVTVDQPNRCIELAVGREMPVPSRIVAPWSSALESLAVLLQGRAAVGHLPIPFDMFRPPARTRAGLRYDQLANLEHIPVERLSFN